MNSDNRWYVITGGPSSGKTTLLAELEKLGHNTIPEAARTVIDNGILEGLTVEQIRKDEKKFQEEVTKMKIKIESLHPKDALTFFDRGMHDTLAYMSHYDFEIADWVESAFKTAKYKKVFLLDQLPVFEKDYARTESQDFPEKIYSLLHEAYKKFGFYIVKVPVLPVKQRAQFILENIEED